MKKLLLFISLLAASFSGHALHLLMGCPDGHPVAYYWNDKGECVGKLVAWNYDCPPTGPIGFKWIYLAHEPSDVPGGAPNVDPGMPVWMNAALDPALHSTAITPQDQQYVDQALQSGQLSTSYVLLGSLNSGLQAYFAGLGF